MDKKNSDVLLTKNAYYHCPPQCLQQRSLGTKLELSFKHSNGISNHTLEHAPDYIASIYGHKDLVFTRASPPTEEDMASMCTLRLSIQRGDSPSFYLPFSHMAPNEVRCVSTFPFNAHSPDANLRASHRRT